MSEIIDNYIALAAERGWSDDTMATYIESDCNDANLAAAFRAQVGAPAPVAATPDPTPSDASASAPASDASASDPSQVTASGDNQPAASASDQVSA